MAITDRRGVIVSATDPAQASDPNPGLAVKAACIAATTVAITLSGLQTIDGVALAAGDRVLVKNQADPTTNGIYNASSGVWQRTTDANSNSEFAPGVQVFVTGGAINSAKTFQLTSASPVVLGTSAITWALLVYPKSGLDLTIDGGGAEIIPGLRPAIEVPFNCTITRMRIGADRVGSIVVDLYKLPFANLPPSPANSICAASLPTLVNQISAQDTTLFNWTLSCSEGDWLFPNVVSALFVRFVTIALPVIRG